MKLQFEYTVISKNYEMDRKELDSYGVDGWILCTITYHHDCLYGKPVHKHYFRREKLGL